MIRISNILLLVCGSLWLLTSCDKQTSAIDSPEVIASVEGRELYKSALDNVIHPQASPQDSSAMATAYVDQWVRDQLLMRQASRLFSSDFEVERLVDDYRERLLKYNLEDKILTERYDTVISPQELQRYYEKMKEDFVLNEDIYRSTYVKFDKETKSLTQFAKDWKKNDTEAIRTFAAAFAEIFDADTTVWRTWDDMTRGFEGFSKSSAQALKEQRQIGGEYEYYLKTHDIAALGSLAPLGYVAPQLKRMLLHQRKQQLLEAYKQELYEKALKDNVIKIR